LNRAALIERLIVEEGLRLKPYVDTVGKVTIGVGRNLTDKGINRRIAFLLLEEDVDEALAECVKHIPSWDKLTDSRRLVLCDMMFNMGWPVLSQFHNLLDAVQLGDWARASASMLGSKWARQVGERATLLAALMVSG